MKKILTLFLSVCLLSFTLFGCEKQDGGLTKIRVNEVTHSIFYAPFYLAIEKGFFEDEGLDIELTNGGGADKVMTALISGGADVAFCGPEAAIYVINEGKTNYPQVFAQLTKRDGSFLVGRNPEPNFKWSNLEGKTVIAGRTGGVPAMTFEYVAKKHGLINGQNVTLDNSVQFNLMGPSFEGGNGDYVTLFEPTASEMQKAGKGYIVASVGAESGEIPYTAFMALEAYISQNKQVLVKFTNALKKAITYLSQTDSTVVAGDISPQFPDTSVESIATSLESYLSIDAWVTDMNMTEDSLNRLQEVMTSAGELDKKVALSTLFNPSVLGETEK